MDESNLEHLEQPSDAEQELRRRLSIRRWSRVDQCLFALLVFLSIANVLLNVYFFAGLP